MCRRPGLHAAERRARRRRSHTGTTGWRRNQASSRPAEDRCTERMREDVVDVEMQLRGDADVVPGGAINGNDRLDAKLHGLSRPQEARVDGAGGAAAIL